MSTTTGASERRHSYTPLEVLDVRTIDHVQQVDVGNAQGPLRIGSLDFTNLANVERLVVIGDVHGCAEELEGLIEKVDLSCAPDGRDCLVLVGDQIHKGPLNHRVLELVREHKALCIRGNHEERLIDWHTRGVEGGVQELHASQLECVAQLDERDWTDVEKWPHLLCLRNFFDESLGTDTSQFGSLRDVIVVHAGLVSNCVLDEQCVSHCVTMRNVLDDGTPSMSRVDGGVPWASRYADNPLVIFGHDAVRGLQQYDRALGLDTGVVYGRELTAVILTRDGKRKFVSQPAVRVHSQPSGPIVEPPSVSSSTS